MEVKNIYRGREIKFYDELMALREDLITDFFNAHPEYTDLKDWGGDHYTPGGWKLAPIKYPSPGNKGNQDAIEAMTRETLKIAEERYPTVYKHILQRFGDACIVVGYAVLWPGTTLKRHTGDENRQAMNIRIHIPLIVPEGDIGMEIYGEEIDWSDLFAFDNQKIHSVWNWTDKPRLILLLDLLRETCDLPQGEPWTQESEDRAPRFPKTE